MNGLMLWAPEKNAHEYFGVERDPFIIVAGVEIRPDRSVSNFKRRSWRERLFTLPWRPLKRFKECEYIYTYHLDGKLHGVCSWKSFHKLRAAICEAQKK